MAYLSENEPVCFDDCVFCEKNAAAEVMDPVALPAALPPAMLGKKQELLFVSLINTELWAKHWHKCFNRSMKKLEEVKIGDDGSIGIGYGIFLPLPQLIKGDQEEDITRITTSNPSLTCGPRGIKASILPFYALSTAPNGTRFGIKKGQKALWVAEKTGDYYYAPPSDRAEGALFSPWQETPSYFSHRFSFRIIGIVSEEEMDMPSHLDTVKKYSVTF